MPYSSPARVWFHTTLHNYCSPLWFRLPVSRITDPALPPSGQPEPARAMTPQTAQMTPGQLSLIPSPGQPPFNYVMGPQPFGAPHQMHQPPRAHKQRGESASPTRCTSRRALTNREVSRAAARSQTER